jgi:hypothetical protein
MPPPGIWWTPEAWNMVTLSTRHPPFFSSPATLKLLYALLMVTPEQPLLVS